MNMDLNIFHKKNLRKSKKRENYQFLFSSKDFDMNLPVKFFEQKHIGSRMLLRTQVPPLKQYGIEVLQGLRRISQNLNMNMLFLWIEEHRD